MNARLVNTAADVIHRAQAAGRVTAAGLAAALDSARLLQSPETAAQVRADALTQAADTIDYDSKISAAVHATAELRRLAVEGGLVASGAGSAPYWRQRAYRAENVQWDSALAPGGEVCAHPDCGQPVESEPCPEHSPAAELARLRARVSELESRSSRYRIAWRMARTRALATGGAADRYAARARDAQEAVQYMLFTVIAGQMAVRAARLKAEELRARVGQLEAGATAARALHVQYGDSAHCQHDGEPWPCPTHVALRPAGEADEDEAPDAITRLIAPTQDLRVPEPGDDR